jgi:protein TonB
MEAKLTHKIQPIYPPMANSVRVQGTVEFTAVVGEQGNVESLTFVRGHPLLVRAAQEAVFQWRYSPTLEAGQPVKVIRDITVNFTRALYLKRQ